MLYLLPASPGVGSVEMSSVDVQADAEQRRSELMAEMDALKTSVLTHQQRAADGEAKLASIIDEHRACAGERRASACWPISFIASILFLLPLKGLLLSAR